MPQPYPDPVFNTTTGMISHVNTITDGWGTILWSIAIVAVAFILMKGNGYRTSDSLMLSFLISFFLSSLLWAAGVLAGKIIVILLLLFVASTLYSIFDK